MSPSVPIVLDLRFTIIHDIGLLQHSNQTTQTTYHHVYAALVLALVLDYNCSGGIGHVPLCHLLATHISTCEWPTAICLHTMHRYNANC